MKTLCVCDFLNWVQYEYILKKTLCLSDIKIESRIEIISREGL